MGVVADFLQRCRERMGLRGVELARYLKIPNSSLARYASGEERIHGKNMERIIHFMNDEEFEWFLQEHLEETREQLLKMRGAKAGKKTFSGKKGKDSYTNMADTMRREDIPVEMLMHLLQIAKKGKKNKKFHSMLKALSEFSVD